MLEDSSGEQQFLKLMNTCLKSIVDQQFLVLQVILYKSLTFSNSGGL